MSKISMFGALRSRLKTGRGAGRRLHNVLEAAARFGYGARGFVYLSAGLLTLLAGLDVLGGAVGTGETGAWLLEQPHGRVWLGLLGVGLWAFVGWRVLQAVFNADNASSDFKGMVTRAGQALSGLFYALLASGVFEILDEASEMASQSAQQAQSIAENQEKASQVLALPFGGGLLVMAGLVVVAVGLGNLIRAWRDDFLAALDCPKAFCPLAETLARAGYAARGFAYLPLGVFVILAGLRSSPGQVTNTAGALSALEAQPGGGFVLAATGLGLAAFGAFAFVEARWRVIRPPRDLSTQ